MLGSLGSTARSLAVGVSVLSMTVALGGCGTTGNGEPATDARDLAGAEEIHGVDVGGVLVLKAERGDGPRVELSGDSNLVSEVELVVEGGVLRARTDSMRPKLDLVLHVRSPMLRSVELSGAARGEIRGVAGDRFDLEVSGASSAMIEGDVERVDIDVSGASEVDARGLQARDVVVDVSGASSAEVVADRSLDAEASGASEIVWRGGATQVGRDVSGASSIEKR